MNKSESSIGGTVPAVVSGAWLGSDLRVLASQIIGEVIDGETRACEIAKLIAAHEAPLRAALKNALDVLEEHADDEASFWGADHGMAKDAAKIYEQAKAALSLPNAPGQTDAESGTSKTQ